MRGALNLLTDGVVKVYRFVRRMHCQVSQPAARNSSSQRCTLRNDVGRAVAPLAVMRPSARARRRCDGNA